RAPAGAPTKAKPLFPAGNSSSRPRFRARFFFALRSGFSVLRQEGRGSKIQFPEVSTRPSTVLGSALFVFYCTAVGVYLLLRPWTSVLAGGVFSGSGFFRGFVSGLGL